MFAGWSTRVSRDEPDSCSRHGGQTASIEAVCNCLQKILLPSAIASPPNWRSSLSMGDVPPVLSTRERSGGEGRDRLTGMQPIDVRQYLFSLWSPGPHP